MCGCCSACRISAGCWSGGKAMSRISTLGSSISASGVVVHLRDAPALRDLLRPWPSCATRSRRPGTGLLVGREMALGHDHAGADAADPVVPAADLHVRLESFGVRHGLLPYSCLQRQSSCDGVAGRVEIVHPGGLARDGDSRLGPDRRLPSRSARNRVFPPSMATQYSRQAAQPHRPAQPSNRVD